MLKADKFKMNNTIILLLTLFFIVSCGGLKDAGKVLRNEKIQTTDEFLVEKKNPLVLPPNFDEIPKPNTEQKIKNSEEESIKKILKIPNTENDKGNKSSSVEESILEKIRK